MMFICTDADRRELMEMLIQEGVVHQVRQLESVRELGTGSFELFGVEANLPEEKCPAEYTQGDPGMRAFRLPSGRLIIADADGNLEQVTIPVPK